MSSHFSLSLGPDRIRTRIWDECDRRQHTARTFTFGGDASAHDVF